MLGGCGREKEDWVTTSRGYTCLSRHFFLYFYLQKEATTATTSHISLSSVISMATKVITSGNDIGLQGHTAWLLGRLYHSSCSVSENKTAGKFSVNMTLVAKDNIACQ